MRTNASFTLLVFFFWREFSNENCRFSRQHTQTKLHLWVILQMGPTGVNRTCVTCCPKPNGAQRCGQSCNHTYPGRMPGTLLSQTAGCWEPLCPWFETLCPPQTFLWQIYFSAMKMCNLTRALCRHQSRVAIHA